jgi:hypothetical protein
VAIVVKRGAPASGVTGHSSRTTGWRTSARQAPVGRSQDAAPMFSAIVK